MRESTLYFTYRSEGIYLIFDIQKWGNLPYIWHTEVRESTLYLIYRSEGIYLIFDIQKWGNLPYTWHTEVRESTLYLTYRSEEIYLIFDIQKWGNLPYIWHTEVRESIWMMWTLCRSIQTMVNLKQTVILNRKVENKIRFFFNLNCFTKFVKSFAHAFRSNGRIQML